MLRICLSTILAVSSLLAASPVYAQIEPVGTESQVPANPAGFQTSPATAVAPSGGSLVVWQSGGSGGQETDIWARAYTETRRERRRTSRDPFPLFRRRGSRW